MHFKSIYSFISLFCFEYENERTAQNKTWNDVGIAFPENIYLLKGNNRNVITSFC